MEHNHHPEDKTASWTLIFKEILANGTKGTPFLIGGFSFLTGDFAYDMHEVYIFISFGFCSPFKMLPFLSEDELKHSKVKSISFLMTLL